MKINKIFAWQIASLDLYFETIYINTITLKYFNLRLGSFLVTILCFVLGFGCNSQKKTSGEELSKGNQYLLIELENSLGGEYISKTYSEHNPDNISRSNRTLNQYRVKFNCSEPQFAELLILLEKDINVLDFKKMEANDSNKAYKSSNSGKTQPIKNK